MSPKELKEKIMGLTKLNEENIHPLHSLMLDECCEKALENDIDEDTLIVSAGLAFKVANDAMIGVINGGLKVGDVVNIDYRGSTFTFKTNTLNYK